MSYKPYKSYKSYKPYKSHKTHKSHKSHKTHKSHKNMKIGFLQQHNTADTLKNIERLCDGIRDLARRGAELVVLQ